MNRLEKITTIRKELRDGGLSIGSWIQIPHPSIAEILGKGGYDWVAVDMEHGAISRHQLPDLFRALELGDTLPLARLSQSGATECKAALDAGAGGVIIPMIESAEQLEYVVGMCRWPPAGRRGVGFSRANLYGRHLTSYAKEAQQPFVVAQIEGQEAVNGLDAILDVDGLDAVMVGPYDLSASMGLTGQFSHPEFRLVMRRILEACRQHAIPAGFHVVAPSPEELHARISEGFTFLAYSLDSVFLEQASQFGSVRAMLEK